MSESFHNLPYGVEPVSISSRQARPRKSLGQHFLADSRIADRIVGAARLTAEDTVLEIGPGRGVLTKRLVRAAGKVVAIELDSQLYEELPVRLDFPDNLERVLGDARETDLPSLAGNSAGASNYKVVGNLPYYAANPIIRLTLESEPPPALAVFMVQREVAERMAAPPGSMSFLSVATQFYAEPKIVCSVPPSAFRPQPKVRSSVVKLETREFPVIDVADKQAFLDFVRACFSAPRKQLQNSLSHGLRITPSAGAAVLRRSGIDGRRRPATLDLHEWASLCASWQEMQATELIGRAS